MGLNETEIVFLGSGRCFHTMDWFRSAQGILGKGLKFVTDNLGGEGFEPLLRAEDVVVKLFLIDGFLFKAPSIFGHRWRNALKLLFLPLQVIALRARFPFGNNRRFFVAHSTYYAFLASLCGIRYSATPQGSEVLVRPFKSKFYWLFLRRSLRSASFVTVDSVAMVDTIEREFGIRAELIQNGICVSEIGGGCSVEGRSIVVSARAISENYRISEILRARDVSSPGLSIYFCYPFVEEGYFSQIRKVSGEADVWVGRLSRSDLYKIFKKASLVISVPASDSSPRSVYEAIFCGAAVACVHEPYVDALPRCMRERVVLVSLEDPSWLGGALEKASLIVDNPFVPSSEALAIFDQVESMKRVIRLIWN